MKEYLEFVWSSAIHPANAVDILAPTQLIIAIICWYYCIRAIVELTKLHYANYIKSKRNKV